MIYRFEVPGPPQAWQRVRRGRNGAVYVPEETARYKLKVQMCARTAGVRKLAGDVVLSCWFYVADRRRRDADNLQKIIQDALNGVAFIDDSQIREWHGAMDTDKERPRAVVQIEERRVTIPNEGKPDGEETREEG